jgi:molybdopterin synthase sulfur carrier subunit
MGKWWFFRETVPGDCNRVFVYHVGLPFSAQQNLYQPSDGRLMARVFIPAQLRNLTDGLSDVEIPGNTLRQIMAGLEKRFPGIGDRLCPEGRIAVGLQVSIDGTITSRGMLAPVGPESEVHFLPAIGGG